MKDNPKNKGEGADKQQDLDRRTREGQEDEEQGRESKKSAFNERNLQEPQLMNENELNPLDAKEDAKATGADGI